MAAASMILVLVLSATAALIAVIILFVRSGRARGGGLSATTRWVLALSGLALFVFLGAGALNTITDRKASPEETIPWLVLIGLAAGGVWIAAQKGVPTRRPSTPAAALPNRKPSQP